MAIALNGWTVTSPSRTTSQELCGGYRRAPLRAKLEYQSVLPDPASSAGRFDEYLDIDERASRLQIEPFDGFSLVDLEAGIDIPYMEAEEELDEEVVDLGHDDALERGVLDDEAVGGDDIGDIEQLHFGYSDLQKGMPLVIAARATDGAHATHARVVPKPLEGREGPCHVALELVSTDARTYVAYGDGFPPGEVVSLAWSYGGNTASHTARTDSTGAFAAAINHEGQPRGRRKWDARLEAVASSCRPAVAYQWGEAGMNP